jgi:hypothetical protein
VALGSSQLTLQLSAAADDLESNTERYVDESRSAIARARSWSLERRRRCHRQWRL